MSERIEVLERPEYIQEPSPMRQIFGDLPVNPSFRPEWLSPLIGPEKTDPIQIKDTIKNRFDQLLEIRQSYGVEGDFVVTNDVAVALLDDNLFENILLETQQDGQTHETARHEIGHKIVAESLGWTASSTVIPGGNYLGLTISAPRANLTIEDWLLQSAAISFGGKIAAEKYGDHVYGTGSDMASIHAKARIAANHPASRFRSEAEFMVRARKIASDALDAATVRKAGANLAYRKTT